MRLGLDAKDPNISPSPLALASLALAYARQMEGPKGKGCPIVIDQPFRCLCPFFIDQREYRANGGSIGPLAVEHRANEMNHGNSFSGNSFNLNLKTRKLRRTTHYSGTSIVFLTTFK